MTERQQGRVSPPRYPVAPVIAAVAARNLSDNDAATVRPRSAVREPRLIPRPEVEVARITHLDPDIRVEDVWPRRCGHADHRSRPGGGNVPLDNRMCVLAFETASVDPQDLSCT